MSNTANKPDLIPGTLVKIKGFYGHPGRVVEARTFAITGDERFYLVSDGLGAEWYDRDDLELWSCENNDQTQMV